MRKLLDILSDGEYYSGEQLGQALGISRAAVWKQVQRLSGLGLEVESVKGRGYRLPGGVALLDGAAINGYLDAAAKSLISQLNIEQSLTSTSEVARMLAEQGDATGAVFFAEQQTAGRGRRGRQWVSPFGRNLYMSVVWGFDSGVEALEGLSLAVGVAAHRAVERCGVENITLKWPNDLLWERRKVGGILLEVTGDPSGFCQVIIGIGLNLDMPESQSEKIDQAWADLSEIASQPVSRNRLAAELLNELLPVLKGYQDKGFASYRDEWQRLDAFRDERVQLTMVSKTVDGIARGVSDTGALCLETDDGERFFSGGEISLRSLR